MIQSHQDDTYNYSAVFYLLHCFSFSFPGIPVNQQHLLYKHKELNDAMVMKDIPLVNGSRLKLVLGMKGGPISSKRLVTISSDYDNWLDMSDVLSG